MNKHEWMMRLCFFIQLPFKVMPKKSLTFFLMANFIVLSVRVRFPERGARPIPRIHPPTAASHFRERRRRTQTCSRRRTRRRQTCRRRSNHGKNVIYSASAASIRDRLAKKFILLEFLMSYVIRGWSMNDFCWVCPEAVFFVSLGTSSQCLM